MISNNNYGDFLEPNIDYIYLTDITKLNDIIIDYKNNAEKANIMRNNYKKKLNQLNYENIAKEMSEIIKNK